MEALYFVIALYLGGSGGEGGTSRGSSLLNKALYTVIESHSFFFWWGGGELILQIPWPR